MPKAKPIDRIELTRRKFGGGHGVVDRTQPRDGVNHSREHSLGQRIINALTESIDAERVNKGKQGLQECPECGSKSLRLDGGCMSCLSCGWSACHSS